MTRSSLPLYTVRTSYVPASARYEITKSPCPEAAEAVARISCGGEIGLGTGAVSGWTAPLMESGDAPLPAVAGQARSGGSWTVRRAVACAERSEGMPRAPVVRRTPCPSGAPALVVPPAELVAPSGTARSYTVGNPNECTLLKRMALPRRGRAVARWELLSRAGAA